MVGPEAPLAAGVVDVFRARGLKIFGPTKAAAQLESSKGTPRPSGHTTAVRPSPTRPALRASSTRAIVRPRARLHRRGGRPIVIKADGLAAGKGVVVAATLEEAHAAVDAMLGDGSMGEAGGMGAYSPAPIVTPELHHRIMREIILPTVQGMTRDGIPYTGFLYAGLMIAPAMIRTAPSRRWNSTAAWATRKPSPS